MNEYRSNMILRDEYEDIIDLGEIIMILWQHAWLLILVMLACGAAGYSYARFVLPEQFESTTKIYIVNKSNGDSTYYNSTDLQAGTYLTKDYSELIVSRSVMEQVVDDLQLPYDYKTLQGMVTVEIPDETRIIEITVEDTNPQDAQTIANEIRVVAADLIQEVMGVEAVNTIETADLPLSKSSPSYPKYALLAALAAFVLVSAVIIVRCVMDDTIKTADDVERYLRLSTLAIIPLDNSFHGETSRKDKKRARRRDRRMRAAYVREASLEYDRQMYPPEDNARSTARENPQIMWPEYQQYMTQRGAVDDESIWEVDE